MTQGYVEFYKDPMSGAWAIRTLDPEDEFSSGKAVRFRKNNGSVSTVHLLDGGPPDHRGWRHWTIGKRTPWAHWPEGEWDEDDQYQVANVQGFLRRNHKPRRKVNFEPPPWAGHTKAEQKAGRHQGRTYGGPCGIPNPEPWTAMGRRTPPDEEWD